MLSKGVCQIAISANEIPEQTLNHPESSIRLRFVRTLFTSSPKHPEFRRISPCLLPSAVPMGICEPKLKPAGA